MASQLMNNRFFAKWLVKKLGLDGNDQPINQIYINGNPIIDDWDDVAKVSIEYIKTDGENNE